MFSTAAEIYNPLIQDNLTNSEGEIVFNFLNVSTRINEKSAIGDLFHKYSRSQKLLAAAAREGNKLVKITIE